MTDKTSPLVALSDPRSPIAEAYRTLRTNIDFAGLDRSIHTLLVTSPAPNEGKSTTLANLAVTMAQSEKKTVLVDADLRRPTLHTLFGIGNESGLTTMLLDAKAMHDPPLEDVGVPNLWLLPSGPPELLGSKRMDDALAALKARADIVLFDAPPVIAVTDAVVLGTRVDGVLLVIGAGQTKRDHAKRAKELLEKVKVRVIGVVLTNVGLDSALGGYYTG